MTLKAVPNFDEFEDLIPSFDKRGMNLELQRVQQAFSELDSPCSSVPVIQVAGTNGKGSIASYLARTLNLAGCKVGLFTSPHLISWCERISFNGQNISSNELRHRLISLKKISKKYFLTPFELLLIAALQHFEFNKAELLVLEVGLGGRLDATTVHPYRPLIAMGSISLDHCQYLGRNLRDVAAEKAAVMTPGSLLITSLQHPEVENVLKEVAVLQKSRISWVEPLSEDWELGLAGFVQRENAAVARRVLENLSLFGWNLTESQIREGFASTFWPARLQNVFWEGLPVLIDGAHNPHGAEMLSKEREGWINQASGVTWILGIQITKDGPDMLRKLIKPLDQAWIIPVPDHKSWSKQQLLEICSELEDQLHQGECIDSVFLELKKVKWTNPPPIVVGSLYLLGNLLAKKIII